MPGQEDFSSAPGLRAGLLSDLSAGDTRLPRPIERSCQDFRPVDLRWQKEVTWVTRQWRAGLPPPHSRHSTANEELGCQEVGSLCDVPRFFRTSRHGPHFYHAISQFLRIQWKTGEGRAHQGHILSRYSRPGHRSSSLWGSRVTTGRPGTPAAIRWNNRAKSMHPRPRARCSS